MHFTRRSFISEMLESRTLLHGAGTEPQTDWLINAGGADYVSNMNQHFQADAHFSPSTGKTGNFAVDKTVNDLMYSSRRFGKDFSYDLPVDNGTYSVKLYFAETYFTSVGKRKFDVFIEGKQVLNDFDMVAQTRPNTAIARTYSTEVADGVLSVRFVAEIDNGIVSALEAHLTKPATDPTPNPPPSSTLNWIAKADAPVKLSEGMGATVGGQVYVFGGYDTTLPSRQATARVSRYDPATNTWSRMADMPQRLTHLGHASDDRYVYLAGGYRTNANGNQTFAVDTVYQYDTQTNTWANLPSLPAARGAGALALVGRELHYYGGVSIDRVDRSDHYVLNIDNPSAGWSKKASLPASKNHLASVTLNGKIYAIGGQIGIDDTTHNQSSVYAYDSATDHWTAVAPMPNVRSHIGGSTFVRDGRIWVAGGISVNGTVLGDVIQYDPATNHWTTVGTLPAPRHSAVAVPLGDKILLTGGYLHGLAQQTWIA
jgi:N-acetylneuraminic acid mutarotase